MVCSFSSFVKCSLLIGLLIAFSLLLSFKFELIDSSVLLLSITWWVFITFLFSSFVLIGFGKMNFLDAYIFWKHLRDGNELGISNNERTESRWRMIRIAKEESISEWILLVKFEKPSKDTVFKVPWNHAVDLGTSKLEYGSGYNWTRETF